MIFARPGVAEFSAADELPTARSVNDDVAHHLIRYTHSGLTHPR